MAMTADMPGRMSGHPQAGRTQPSTKVLALPTPATASATQGATPVAQCLRRLTPAEMAAKREKGECFNCSEKFSRAHLEVCPMKGLFLLELESAEDEELDNAQPLISLNAITGILATETMRLQVHLLDTVMEALVDSGSTHSFISLETASRLHLQPDYSLGIQIMVANGDRVVSTGICRGIHIFINNEEFVLDFFIIPLAGYEMVLGVQWMHMLGPILWDFGRAQMSCWRDDHRVVWQGVPAQRTTPTVQAAVTTDLMETLLDEFAYLFSIPMGLPPPRHNHRIHLLPGTAPIAVQPYRYPQLVKNELERQCAEMLQQGIIRPSSSAFSSLVLLVKKHDGT
jgi:predicted aspartyl protease